MRSVSPNLFCLKKFYRTAIYSNNGGLIKPAYSSLKIKDYSIFPKPAMNDLWQITAAICISDKVKNALMKANISNIAYEAVSVY